MAYTITFKKSSPVQGKVLDYLRARLVKEGKFSAIFVSGIDRVGRPIILVQNVRLVKAKAYCGNHPGPCVVNPYAGARPKPVNKHLEWDDWVRFHSLVNRVLNRFHVEADVWSQPRDARGKFWIRRGKVSRVRYDYEESGPSYNPLRIWNTGTPDQFEKEVRP